MIIPYNQQPTYMDELDIDNIGEFAVKAWNDEQLFWYLIVRTTLGTATIASSGPTIPDFERLPKNFSQQRYQMQFNEGKITREVAMFLNDRNKKITGAEVIPIEEAIEEFVDLKGYLSRYSEELT